MRSSLAPVIAGAVIGLPLAVGVARAFKALLFEVTSLDPVDALLGTSLVVAVALVAAWGPARRAASVDPVSVVASTRPGAPVRRGAGVAG